MNHFYYFFPFFRVTLWGYPLGLPFWGYPFGVTLLGLPFWGYPFGVTLLGLPFGLRVKYEQTVAISQMLTGKTNPFAALARPDSDSESEDTPKKIPVLRQQPTVHNTPILPPSSPPFRVWNLQPELSAVFSASPFSSKKKRGKVVHAEADHDGWVSIKKSQPMFVDDSANSSDTEKEIKKEALLEALGELASLDEPTQQQNKTEEAPLSMRSLLSRGQNEMTALDWAERVRASLERAEAQRRPAGAPSSTDAFVSTLGRLSFFRRPLVNEGATGSTA